MSYTVAVLGSTGLVGRTMMKVLEEKNFPVSKFIPLASANSLGKKVIFKGQEVPVVVPTNDVWDEIDIALFSAGGQTSLDWAPIAAERNAVVIDNSSAFRMNSAVPLVVPEVNGNDIFDAAGSIHKIIANPNCSTIQMVVALKPLHDKYKIKKIVVSTYQSVTGKGKIGLEALEAEMKTPLQEKYTHFKPIAYNVVPQIDVFTDNGYTKEEMKMVLETKKIMHDESIQISPTTVRVPVYGGHSEAIHLEFENHFDIDDVFLLLRNAKGIVVQDDVKNGIYPVPIECYGKDEVFVGRIRRDLSNPKALNLWVVADNLRKGAATNAVQIAELLQHKLIPKVKKQ